MQKCRVVVLSIDGVPLDLMKRMTAEGVMPHMAEFIRQNSLRQMRSVHPTVSAVAWANYMTGKNPGKHGIYGFIDRRENSYNLMFPNSAVMATENIWEILSQADKRVFGMNVPVSYPPRQVNGIPIAIPPYHDDNSEELQQ